jgi:hypothetical protein
MFANGAEFYQRLALKSETDLQAGELSHEEVEESRQQLEQMQEEAEL